MKTRGIRTVMVFVADPPAAARFWSRALEARLHEHDPLVDLGDLELFFHAADDRKNPQGGTVVYFGVDDFDAARDELLAAGCTPHRGPLTLPSGQRICQLRDPFGTIWGLESLLDLSGFRRLGTQPRALSHDDGPEAILASMPAPLIEFPADDPGRARRFWHGVLGVELLPRPAASGSGWETDTSDVRLGLHARGAGPGDTASLPYFTVDDLPATLLRISELGGSVIHPGDRWAVCRDSEGSAFALAAAPASEE